MARAREKPTAPAKPPSRAVAGERSHGAHAEPAPAPKRAPARAPRKHAGHGDGERAPVRAARSTERSAVAEPAQAPRPGAARRRLRTRKSPLAISVGVLDVSREGPERARVAGGREHEGAGRVMELHWGDDTPSSRRPDGLVQRWIKRGDALLRHLAEHGAARHEYRADLKEGRFVWVDPDGRVSARGARAGAL